MKDFSPAQGPIYTFFSAAFYRDLLLNGKGMGFCYLFILLLVCWSLQSVKTFTMLQGYLAGKDVGAIVEQIPNHMEWKSGKFSMDCPSPHIITLQGAPLIFMDTSGKTTSLEQAGGAPLLITDEAMIMAGKAGVESKSWSEMVTHDTSLDRSGIKSGLALIVPYGTGIYAACGLFVWLTHLIQALLYGVVGLVMDQKKLGYVSQVRLASFAMTPVIIVSTLLWLLQVPGQLMILLSLPVVCGFMYMGNNAVSKADTPAR